MTAPDYARLRELASAATAEHDARYLADCDPQTILALLDERDALAREVAELEAEATKQSGESERFKEQRDAAAKRAGQRRAERDQLAAVVERVREVANGLANHAALIRDAYAYNDYDRGRTIAFEDAHKELDALLPKEAP